MTFLQLKVSYYSLCLNLEGVWYGKFWCRKRIQISVSISNCLVWGPVLFGIKQLNWTELNWTELNWTELNWTELNWTDLNWSELNWTELNWTGLKWIVICESKSIVKSWTELIWTELNWTELNWTELNWIELNWTENKLGRTGPQC